MRNLLCFRYLKFLIAICLLNPQITFAASKLPTAKPVPTEEEKLILETKPYSTVHIIAGAGTAYIAGFGLGQTVEGVWLDRGWYFTIADLVGFTALISGLGDCSLNDSSCESKRSGTMGFGMVTFALSRIWQVVDAIYYPNKFNDQYEELAKKYPDFTLISDGDRTVASLKWQF